MSVKLQLALDLVDLQQALRVASEAAPYVDVLEAGTPLIKRHGLDVVCALRREFPRKLIFADMKTADVGDLEVRLAAESGADLVSVLAVAPVETMVSAVAEAHRLGNVAVVADLLGVKNVVAVTEHLLTVGADYILVHCGIDEQRAGRAPFATARVVSGLGHLRLAVAGGINFETLDEVLAIPNLAIVVVGGAITSAHQPGLVAREFYEQIQRRTHHGRPDDARDSGDN